MALYTLRAGSSCPVQATGDATATRAARAHRNPPTSLPLTPQKWQKGQQETGLATRPTDRTDADKYDADCAFADGCPVTNASFCR